MKNIVQLNKSKCFQKLFIFPILILLFCSFAGKGIQFNLNNEQRGIRDTVPAKELNNIKTESEYPGGKQAWMMYLMRQLRYPLSAMNNSIQGTVTVKFIIDEKGRLKQLDAISGPMELRQEAIRVIQESGRWMPAKENGKAINLKGNRQLLSSGNFLQASVMSTIKCYQRSAVRRKPVHLDLLIADS